MSSNDFSSSWGVHVVCYNDIGTSATWSTHNSKQYRAICDLIYKGSEWGWATAYLYIIDHSFQWCSTTPISVVPAETSKQLIFYLRGGGKYYIDTPSDMSWTIKTSTWTINNESFPLKSYNDVSLMNVGNNGREDSVISSSNPGKPHAVKTRTWYNTGTRV